MLDRVRRRVVAAVLAATLASCAGQELRPAAEATPAALRGEAAVAAELGRSGGGQHWSLGGAAIRSGD